MKRLVILAVAAVAACSHSTSPEPIASVAEPLTIIPDNGGTFTGSTAANAPGVTNQYGGTCGGSTAREQVYQWRAPRSGNATFATCGSSYDTVLYVRKSTIAGTELGCNDDAPSCAVDASKFTKAVVACTTYFIFVDGWSTTSGPFSLTVTPPTGSGSTCANDASAEAGQDAATDTSSDGADAVAEGGSDATGDGSDVFDSSGSPGDGIDGADSSADLGDGSQQLDVATDAGEVSGDAEAGGPDGLVDGFSDDGGAVLDGGGGGDAGTGPYPLKKQAGARYLVDQSGAPFLIHGDAAWSLIANTTIEDATLYLNDRQARGFNTIIVNLVEHFYSSNPPKNAYGDQPFTTQGDIGTPNEAYFARADSVIQAAAARGIQVLLFPLYLGNNGGSEGFWTELASSGTARATAYGTFVGNRYRGQPNILWVVGGDYTPPDGASGKDLVNALGNAIKAADPNHLMTEHGSRWRVAALDDYAGQPWLDVNAVYTAETGGAIGGAMLGQYNRANWLPTFFIEGLYENEFMTAADLRRQSYEALLNGGVGSVFGSSPVWCLNTSGPCVYSTGPSDWRTALGSVGAQDQTRVWSLFSVRRWDKLVPTCSFITSGSIGASCSKASDGTWAAAYVSSSRSVTVNLAAFSPSLVTASWYSPTSGAFTVLGTFANSGTRTWTSPAGDSVLVVE